MNQGNERRILLGAGGHARVLVGLCQAADFPLHGLCDPYLNSRHVPIWEGIPVLGDDDYLVPSIAEEAQLINGLGHTIHNSKRADVFTKFENLGFRFPNIIHPFSWVAQDVNLGSGVQIMAGVIIQPSSVIGSNSIINTQASVDHECEIGSHCHVAPGATLCGSVIVQDGAFIGAGATVLHGITVGEGSIVGAGVTLYKSLSARHKVLGAKPQVQRPKEE